MSKIVLIDGYSIINRAFYGVPLLTNSEGRHTNAVYGFLNILFKLVEEEQPSYLAVAFDVKAPTFRHEMYEGYKGTRKPMPAELTEQVPMLKEVLKAMGICCVEKAGYEADDLLGTIARRCEADELLVSLVSGDRDLLQIATDKTTIIIPKTKGGKTEIFRYDTNGVVELYGVTPTEFIDMKALMGDASDNIPGLPGVGEKTAGKLIAQFHSIEGCMEHLAEIKPPKAQKAFEEHYDLAVLSKKLARIETNADIDFHLEQAALGELYTPEAYELIKKYNFKSMLERFSAASVQKAQTEPSWQEVSELSEACSVLEQAKNACGKGVYVGASVMKDAEHIYGLALCMDDAHVTYIAESFFVNEDWFASAVKELLLCGAVWMNAKEQLYLLAGDDRYQRYSYLDVGLAAYLLNPLQSSYAYEEVAGEHLGLTMPGAEELLGKHREHLNPETQGDAMRRAAVSAAWVSHLAMPVLLEKLSKTGQEQLYREMELPVLGALFRMECQGIICQKEALKTYGDNLVEGISRLEQEIHQEAGCDFNINSPKQLGEVLFERLQMPGGKKTKSGYSTAADVLDKLAPEYPIVRKVLDYRQLTKLKSTYADGLAGYIQADGRIHGTFNQTITATGRISSTEPNLQNIPVRMELGRAIRKLFVPKEGCVFVDADYSQIELRILAHMSGDENLIGAYQHSSDIHATTAATVFHVPLEEVTPQMRRNAKAVNFGIVYGISAFGLSEDLSISRKQANEYIEAYFESYPGVKKFLDAQVASGKEQGYVTTMYGRRRPIPELKAANFMQRQFGERVAMNSPIQGSAADIMKLAMLRVEQALVDAGLRARIILQVHDELLLETPVEEVEQVKAILQSQMRDSFALRVPLEIGISVGNTWYETK
jgi:DNA polymerase-1